MAPAINPNAHQIIEEFLKAYPEKSQNVRKYIPKISAPIDTLQALNVKYDTTTVDITTTTGEPVEIPVSYTSETVSVVDFGANTPPMDIRHFANADVIKTETEIVLKQFLCAENTLFKNILDSAPVNTIEVDTTSDSAEATIEEVTNAIDIACFEIETYTNAPKLMLMSPDVKKYFYKRTPELKKPMDIVKENGINVVQLPQMAGSDVAYIIPLSQDICKMVQVKPLKIAIEELPYEMASIYGKESIAFIVNQPHVIQKLDFTVK